MDLAADIRSTTSELTPHDRNMHLQARLGYHRMEHKVAPGLYRLGSPTGSSPVLVSANYALSFDALRSALAGIDCYILVLDTQGVNVWCAAGKGTFGTEELVERVSAVGLEEVVQHRKMILPQLAAPGVSAHEVEAATGFEVAYGPVRAEDLPEYLQTGEATPEMRKVSFPLRERAVLTPVELMLSLKYLLPVMLALFLLSGALAPLIALTAVLGGTVLFPLLLPYLPGKEFSPKGLFLGFVLSLPFIAAVLSDGSVHGLALALLVASVLLMVPSVVGYLALNFTGSSTYTSRTGVRKEIFRWVPVIAAMVILGLSSLIMAAAMQWGWF